MPSGPYVPNIVEAMGLFCLCRRGAILTWKCSSLECLQCVGSSCTNTILIHVNGMGLNGLDQSSCSVGA